MVDLTDNDSSTSPRFLQPLETETVNLLLLSAVCLTATPPAAENPRPLKLGIIGLDTSHSVEFTKILNDSKAAGELAGAIVAAFPGGSPRHSA